MGTSRSGSGISVDGIIDRWREVRPDLDPSAKALTGRIIRLAGLLQRRFCDDFAVEGIDEGGFAVLAALRRVELLTSSARAS